MSSFADGKHAYGICDITGFRYRLRDMKKTWNGYLVGPVQWDPKHPQLQPRPAPIDSESLKDPRPDTDDDNNAFVVYTNVGLGKIGKKLDTFEATVDVGEVTITTS